MTNRLRGYTRQKRLGNTDVQYKHSFLLGESKLDKNLRMCTLTTMLIV